MLDVLKSLLFRSWASLTDCEDVCGVVGMGILVPRG